MVYKYKSHSKRGEHRPSTSLKIQITITQVHDIGLAYVAAIQEDVKEVIAQLGGNNMSFR